MRLFHSPTSPYVRKVMVAAHEAGLVDRITIVPVTVSPMTRDARVGRENPLGKVPTLVLDDGTALFDSRVIAEHLDTLHDGTKLFPTAAEPRRRALTQQALGDGLLDAALLVRYETVLRPEALRWPAWVEGQSAKARAALDAMETAAEGLGEGFQIGAIAFGCALGYLDFRFADWEWRRGRPALAAWFERISRRTSMLATAPKDPA